MKISQITFFTIMSLFIMGYRGVEDAPSATAPVIEITRDSCVLFIKATLEQIDQMRADYETEEDFYIMTDDAVYYNVTSREYLEGKNADIIYLDSVKVVRFNGGDIFDFTDLAWDYVFYKRGSEPKVVKPINVSDDYDSYFGIQPQHTIDGYTLNDVGWACLKGDLEGFKVLIADGGSFEECMEDEIYMFDAMYAAVYGGQKHVVDYLIEKGLNVNRFYTEDGETPLFMACRRNKTDIADALLRAGADANGAGDMGGDYTLYPIIEAVYNQNLPLVELLVEYGAAVDITNKQGESPLASAIRNEDEEMISLLKQSMEFAPKSVKK